MKHTYLNHIAENNGKEVTIKGWAFNIRSSGSIKFIQIRDGSGTIQAVAVKGETPDNVFEEVGKLTVESSLSITGIITENPKSWSGYEISIKNITIYQIAPPWPLGKKSHGTDFLMNNRDLWLRAPRQRAIMRIRDVIIKSLIYYFDEKEFLRLDTPIFTPNACEGTTTLFETEYFDTKAYLSQSGQLYNEATMMAHGKVYCFSPAFRAEKSKTRRHLTEFWMLEPEMAFCDLDDNMEIQEEMICYVIDKVLKKCEKELKLLKRDVKFLKNIKAPFPRVHYKDAIKKLQENGSDIKMGDDLGGDDETILTNLYSQPIFVHHFPKEIKAFYMKEDPNELGYVLGSDMLAPEGYGEVIGGGQREENYDKLKSLIEHHNLPLEAFSWYLNIRKYGSVPHGGFGIGIERFVAWVCKLPHVRETNTFPRMLSRLTP